MTLPQATGLYDPRYEHDACGVGFVAALDGVASRRVVEAGIEALKCLWHRGAVDADGKTGDGAGIHVEIPQDLFTEHVQRTGHAVPEGRIAVGMIFLPRTDTAAQERCRCIVETIIQRRGYRIYGWRQVPIDIKVIGEKANATRPEIEQIMLAIPPERDMDAVERDLYITRRQIENAAWAESLRDFYICSLSARSIIYKGMFLAEQLSAFYPDLSDERFVSRFALYHQRYSTNTFPTWKLAQPFRMLAHNGEINTLTGNENWMRVHEAQMQHPDFGDEIEDLKPVIQPGSSDSAALDAAFEVLSRAGRPAPWAKLLLIPGAGGVSINLPDDYRALLAYCHTVMQPWDGPAALCVYDGRWLIGGMDRNGLRPMRYAESKDGLLILGSEAGMVPVEDRDIICKGRVGPGEMVAVDLQEGRFYDEIDIRSLLTSRQDYRAWSANTQHLDALLRETAPPLPSALPEERLRRIQLACGQSLELHELVLHPMAETGKEALASMGDDTPLAVLSEQYRPLHHFFRQNFSQVTNPPIDSLRERRVMSLNTRLGNLRNVLDESAAQCDVIQLLSPILSSQEAAALQQHLGKEAQKIDCTLSLREDFEQTLARLVQEAQQAVEQGITHLTLTDEAACESRMALPMILATAAIHSHLCKTGLRGACSLNIRSAEALDVHYMAVLIGVGATTVNPWLAEQTLRQRHARGLFGEMPLETVLGNYRKALDDGLLKIMSKMGISVLSSYRGGMNFEAIGLSRALVATFFPACPSRISGIGLSGLECMAREQHALAYQSGAVVLPVGGFFRFRHGSEYHAWEGRAIHALQMAVASGNVQQYKRYSAMIRGQKPVQLRDLLDFRTLNAPIKLDQVESITGIRKRFVTPGMSLGALSPEAHGMLNVAMNRMGAKSDSGEGGEDPAHFVPDAKGDNWNSAIKQIASGRFGVTADYLNACREIEIKIAQGAKPGEGGQLPGFKVTELIARLRHATPGVTLISPPPHHDIYSIEDLAQLIYDLKQINPVARVCVKLVARTGIGTIAAGVAKAKADVILIAGHNGGTGASPQNSIKFAGMPWEIGLAETHQVLTLNNLRDRVILRTDGGLKTGRDIVMAAILGAEEYGIGTASLVAMGCLMVRQCHANTCPVGICTQDPALREKFVGTPEKLVNLFSFIAEEVREILAELGVEKLDDLIGRTSFLRQVSRGPGHLDDLDLNPLMVQIGAGDEPRISALGGGERNEVPAGLDQRMIADAAPFFERGEKMQLHYTIRNTDRTVGTRFSSEITRRYGMSALQPDHVTINLRGTAGQSLGAWLVQGVKLDLCGDANDYVGKGLSGGKITIRPTGRLRSESQNHVIIGNTVLYGATAGSLYAAGRAGERFAVRNSGADTVVEGCGANGCEYMTGGRAVILGAVGANFGAGMTGGMAYVLDLAGDFEMFLNPDSVYHQRLDSEQDEAELKSLIETHLAETESQWAAQILNDWPNMRQKIWQIIPREIMDRLEIAPSDSFFDENQQAG